jgi:hypothetical protein
MDFMNWTGRMYRFAIVSLVGAWLIVFVAGVFPTRAAAAPAADIPWLITCEDQPWGLALAAPVAARLQESGSRPLLMAVTNPPTREAEWLLTLSTSASGHSRRPIVLATSERMKLGTVLQRRSPTVLRIGSDPCAASAAVARRFWTQSHSAVVAAADDPEAEILGSALAASLRVPLLLCGRDLPGSDIEGALKELSVARILVAVSDARNSPRWIDKSEIPSELLPPQALQHRLIAALGRDKIRNVVVARAPDDRADVGHSAWLAPYVSLSRNAAVVLVRAHAAAVAEADVRQLIERESLPVRTVTVLADYTSIGYRNVEVDPNGGDDWPSATFPEAPASPASLAPAQPMPSGGTSAVVPPPAPPPHYTVRTEPFVPTQPDQLAEFGVGRLPLESLSDTSVMFVRGLLRERMLAQQPSRVLMVANSGMLRKLVICETISRITASEFKNLGVHVDEFYGRWADAPEILSAARAANVILYEGHLSAQELIDAPVMRRAPTQDYPEDEDDLEGGAERPAMAVAPAPRVVLAEPIARHLQGPLNGLPIVFLQSCESLDDAVLWRLDELGGVALIGSMTSIHSAAGSAILNAAMDSFLYRGGTLGEVLRDAQNYILCVEELKGRRGHKEQAKGVRVALSFRLWGDPELRVLPMPPLQPRQAPVRAEWIGRDTLRITLPAERLPEAHADKYAASTFPNSQFAGLTRTENDATKRISPVYFFCLPLPDNLTANDASFQEPSRGDAKHLEIRVDRGRRMAYVVYLPDQEKPGESVVLRLRKSRPAEESGRSSP